MVLTASPAAPDPDRVSSRRQILKRGKLNTTAEQQKISTKVNGYPSHQAKHSRSKAKPKQQRLITVSII